MKLSKTLFAKQAGQEEFVEVVLVDIKSVGICRHTLDQLLRSSSLPIFNFTRQQPVEMKSSFWVWRLMMPPRAGCHSRLCHIIVNRCLWNEHVWTRRSFAQQTNLNRPCWSLCGQWLGSPGRHRWSWWHFYTLFDVTLNGTSMPLSSLYPMEVVELLGRGFTCWVWVWLPTIQNRWLLDVSNIVWPHKVKSLKGAAACSLIWVLNFLTAAASLFCKRDWFNSDDFDAR